VAEQSWKVYILECADNSLYTGITLDTARRLGQHNNGTASKYTRGRLPIKNMFVVASIRSKSWALKLEYAIKKLPRRKKNLLIYRI